MFNSYCCLCFWGRKLQKQINLEYFECTSDIVTTTTATAAGWFENMYLISLITLIRDGVFRLRKSATTATAVGGV